VVLYLHSASMPSWCGAQLKIKHSDNLLPPLSQVLSIVYSAISLRIAVLSQAVRISTRFLNIACLTSCVSFLQLLVLPPTLFPSCHSVPLLTVAAFAHSHLIVIRAAQMNEAQVPRPIHSILNRRDHSVSLSWLFLVAAYFELSLFNSGSASLFLVHSLVQNIGEQRFTTEC
jgi:hypothetical protein